MTSCPTNWPGDDKGHSSEPQLHVSVRVRDFFRLSSKARVSHIIYVNSVIDWVTRCFCKIINIFFVLNRPGRNALSRMCPSPCIAFLIHIILLESFYSVLHRFPRFHTINCLNVCVMESDGTSVVGNLWPLGRFSNSINIFL